MFIKKLKKKLCEHDYEELETELYYVTTWASYDLYCIYCPKCTLKLRFKDKKVADNLVKQSKLRNKYLSDKQRG